MIKVIINGLEREYPEDKYSTFGDLWEEIKPQEKVVVDLKINDKTIPISRIEELFNVELDGNEVVEMRVQSIDEATLNLIDEALGYISKIEERLPELSNKVITGQMNQAMSDLKHVIDGISALENMRESISKIVDVKIFETKENIAKFQKSLEILNNINKSLMEQNYTDLVEDIDVGLPRVFDFYRRFLNNAKEQIIKRSEGL